MNRALIRRLEKLEQNRPATAYGKAHQIICKSEEECDAKVAELRASPEWEEGDRLTVWKIVDPPVRRSWQ